jgi:glyoxylase-like metal-dependent hydrolase (beta-lactamase superfamily II)
MDGSTVVIGPPDGNMADYLESLNKLFKYKIDCLAPGHGNFMYEPKKVIESIIRHRLSREAKVLRRLEDVGDIDLESLTAIVYDDVPEQLTL